MIAYLFKDNKYEEFDNTPPFRIDLVYTWAGEDVTHNIRTDYNNELKYSLRSVMKYMPWINRIYILMNPPKKIPSWFNPDTYHGKITLVDQSETFPPGTPLPNRNSNAIETTLTNIPGLAEHFIYMNDDLFVGRPVEYTEFFSEDGSRIVVHEDTKNGFGPMFIGENKLGFEAPNSKNLFYLHIPMARLKSIENEYKNQYPEYINWVRNQRVRNDIGCDVCRDSNMLCPCQLQNYIIARYHCDKGACNYKDYNHPEEYRYFNSSNIHAISVLFTSPARFFCINDTELDPVRKRRIKRRVTSYLSRLYPEKPFFEL